ncbi:MAG: DUF3990 domain-containing protein [Spirochaetia bacterium]|nr:DUF3990 domain-containing protein [Spirochaetia bacterium]
MILYHGSDHIIKEPQLALGKPNNDYGRGFYCTFDYELAQEWACKNGTDGFVNMYEFPLDGLEHLNQLDGNHTVLNWIALLLKNRKFSLSNEIAVNAKDYIISHFCEDTSVYDVLTGYRADDSYFAFAESFVENGLPLRSLTHALYFGHLGSQTVLISKKAFEAISFIEAKPVDKSEYFPLFKKRDDEARKAYKLEMKKVSRYKNDLFVMDIIRKEIDNNDARIQRILFK